MNMEPSMHRIEWPTFGLALIIYGGWLIATAWHSVIGWPLLAVIGGWFVAWHGSLQHETIHGHPTSRRWLNALIGGWPLSLWLPYRVYRRSHVAHHRSPHPTHPVQDPESRYLLRDTGIAAASARAEQSLLGRMTLGPLLSIGRFVVAEGARARHEPRTLLADWGLHLAGVVVVLTWLAFVELPIERYLLCFVLPGQALSLLRGYAEHRADSAGPSRAATVDSRGIFALLFLNNNLHAAHHARPEAPWYALPTIERQRQAPPEPRYRGYRDVLRRFAFRAHDRILHPSIKVRVR